MICGELVRDPEDRNTVGNPRVIIEVLSDSTEAYDRGKKFQHYRSCPSFLEYVLVASRGTPCIERFVRTDEAWTICKAASVGETVSLSSVELTLDVDAIYRGLVGTDGQIREL